MVGISRRQTRRTAAPGARLYHSFVNWLRLRTIGVPPLLVDGAIAAILWSVGAAQLLAEENRQRPGPARGPFGGPPGGPEGPDGYSYLLLGLSAGFLALRRRNPVAALTGVALFGAAFLVRSEPVFPVQLIVLVAIYTMVADSSLSRLEAVAVSLAAAAILGAAIYFNDDNYGSASWAMNAAWIFAAIVLGDSVRSRREIAAQEERGREEEALRRVSEERLQIARELHDVVGHNISLINVQAGAGSHVLYKDPQQARETFDNIRNASHETLQELRSLVGVLRDPVSVQSKAPTVGLDELEHLVQGFVEAGLDVQLKVTGARRHVSGIADLSAYRILQEALTNAVRHARGARVVVNVHYGADEVSLSVTNSRGENAAAEAAGDGHGLTGMRERVTAIGGELDAGPDADGGFHVRAVLPLTGGAS
jgi:signal transduction histidine kinase